MTPSEEMIPRRLRFKIASHVERKIGPTHFSNLAVGIGWLRIAENGAVLKNVLQKTHPTCGYHNPGMHMDTCIPMRMPITMCTEMRVGMRTCVVRVLTCAPSHVDTAIYTRSDMCACMLGGTCRGTCADMCIEMYADTCQGMCAGMCTDTCVCTHVCVHMCVYTCVCTHVHGRVHAHVNVRTCRIAGKILRFMRKANWRHGVHLPVQPPVLLILATMPVLVMTAMSQIRFSMSSIIA